MHLRFEWDENKSITNFNIHKVSFIEAQTVFYDSLAFIFDDEWHSTEDELREIIVGHSNTGRLLFVCFIEQIPRLIRIISARYATKRERIDYEEGRNERE